VAKAKNCLNEIVELFLYSLRVELTLNWNQQFSMFTDFWPLGWKVSSLGRW